MPRWWLSGASSAGGLEITQSFCASLKFSIKSDALVYDQKQWIFQTFLLNRVSVLAFPLPRLGFRQVPGPGKPGSAGSTDTNVKSRSFQALSGSCILADGYSGFLVNRPPVLNQGNNGNLLHRSGRLLKARNRQG